jgi:lysophospholipase L1-like esterase
MAGHAAGTPAALSIPDNGLMPDSIASDLDTLARHRIFFAHQSVGANILDGLRDLLREHGRDFVIAEWGRSPAPSDAAKPGGVLWHARVGRNEEPASKCEHFSRLLDEELAGQVDIALLKFCYIDINQRTDVARLFDQYQQTFQDLARRHPSVTFVPVTAPLRHAASGPGIWLRERLGLPNRSKRDNLARQAFNVRLRERYAGTPLFDLAAAEATRPDGRREVFTYESTTAESLVGGYTDDGGHLNAAGRRAVAAAFVRALKAAELKAAELKAAELKIE